MSEEGSQTKKDRKSIERILKRLDETDRKIYLMNEKIAGIKQKLGRL